MQCGSILSPTPATTISITNNSVIPRKSALKQTSVPHKSCNNGSSTFRSAGQQLLPPAQPHLPPPEFADMPSPPEQRASTQPVLEFISPSGNNST